MAVNDHDIYGLSGLSYFRGLSIFSPMACGSIQKFDNYNNILFMFTM